ncbi:unnamed protein product [Rotaria sordida]|uniref:WWE domain-containing protein n=3 Tax=Rotaria sordida TaxID=392033 RepID=A0A819J4G5_9BILA|nr:unnamed protein product [Rotaria sordida]CAF1094033.1 unnamed protein product [Rotaria sordida]CAF1130424.1 unnamed protein product [Rotaria sordida]CAF1353133.1 unnamed protein product [Rotaria sordida]CAF3927254.1 unnamed protein product [Rotaria sordida]
MKGVTWFWKANTNPWSSNEIEQWIPFPNIINRQIEQAYQGRQLEVVISEKYKIDLNRLLQIDILNFDRQRPVRRCSKAGDTLAYYRRERFNFAQPIQRSIADDTLNYGCSFVTDWFILFTKVNRTLRDDDRSKLTTLGPFCYLMFNYIGIRHNEYMSIRNQLKRFVKKTDNNTSEITVYRGETLSLDDIEIYKNAVGKGDFYKWLSFVSTSRSRDAAEEFGSNVLHIITIKRSSSNDQYVDLEPISYYNDEEEILLRPGVRFKIDDTYDDPITGRCIFHIQIEPSFISNLM